MNEVVVPEPTETMLPELKEVVVPGPTEMILPESKEMVVVPEPKEVSIP